MAADTEADAAPAASGEQGEKVAFLLRSALSLVSTSIVTSGLGFVYWAAAARFFSASEVGESATAIAAMNLVAPFTTLGLGTLLLVRLPAMAGRRAELVTSAAVVSALFGGLLALALGLLLPTSFLGLTGIGSEPVATVVFAAGVAAQGVGAVLDAALISVEGGGLQLARNSTMAAVKLVLLVGAALTLSVQGSLSIYTSWFLANLLSIVLVVAWLARRRRVGLRRLVPSVASLRGLHLDAAQHHALNLALQVPFFAMPIVANVALGSEQAGYLYATWSIAGFVFVLPIALATALFASGARDAGAFVAHFRLTLRASLAACVVANLLVLPLGGFVLAIFGRDYADNGHTTLGLLCVAGLGLIVKDHHVTIARVTGRVGAEARLVWLLTTLELVGASLGAVWGGLTGLATGWLLVVVLEAVVYGPAVVRAYRGRVVPGPAGGDFSNASSDL